MTDADTPRVPESTSRTPRRPTVADFSKRHRYEANDRDPGFCKCGLAAGAWQHTDTSAYVERPLTAEVWKELRGQPDTEIARADTWAREREDRDEAAAQAAAVAAEEADHPEPSAYDQDPDIDEPEEGDRG